MLGGQLYVVLLYLLDEYLTLFKTNTKLSGTGFLCWGISERKRSIRIEDAGRENSVSMFKELFCLVKTVEFHFI